MGMLEGYAAVITGGANGMGRDTVWRFLDEGASVVVADINEANGAKMLEDANARGVAERLRFVRVDVAQELEHFRHLGRVLGFVRRRQRQGLVIQLHQ